jgi:hypothetical protein
MRSNYAPAGTRRRRERGNSARLGGVRLGSLGTATELRAVRDAAKAGKWREHGDACETAIVVRASAGGYVEDRTGEELAAQA